MSDAQSKNARISTLLFVVGIALILAFTFALAVWAKRESDFRAKLKELGADGNTRIEIGDDSGFEQRWDHETHTWSLVVVRRGVEGVVTRSIARAACVTGILGMALVVVSRWSAVRCIPKCHKGLEVASSSPEGGARLRC